LRQADAQLYDGGDEFIHGSLFAPELVW